MKKKLIIIGASGHGKVLLDIALKNQYEILGFLDDNSDKESIAGYPILGRISDSLKYKDEADFVIGIGSNSLRKDISNKYELNWATLVHPSAVVGIGVIIEEGTVIMANAVINPFATIGKHCIINTSSVVEHDNIICDYVHISPGAVLAGSVYVGEMVHIGANATVRNNINIVSKSTLGAGATLVKDIVDEGIYIGVPARRKND